MPSRFRMVLPLLIVCPAVLAGQRWQPGADLDVVRRAAEHRLARDADTLLASWSAQAHGVVRFASVLDHGDGPVERVIKADELRVEVYGEAPNRSKQIIVAWRDTTFLPNHVVYHRDHLGIITNDFGAAIRIGDGDEVRDIVQPLSPRGLSWYRFAVGDTLLLSGPNGRVRVVAVQVRPADPDSAGAVGTLYLDVDRAALVRFQFTFTGATYRDPTVEDITVTLENALQENVRWLPWRQSIVIRRSVGWLDLPIHTVIREDWTLDNYQLGVRLPVDRFAGPPIAGLRAPEPGNGWPGPIAASLDALPATEADVAEEQRAASAMLAGRLLGGMPHLRILAHGLSDLLRVNRVEGITPGFGAETARGAWTMRGSVGYGFSDRRAVGTAEIDAPPSSIQWSLDAGRRVRDVADQATYSGAINSLATAVWGGDRGDYTLVDDVALTGATTAHGIRFSVAGGGEWTTSVATTFVPLSGSVASNPALGAGRAAVIRVNVGRLQADGDGWHVALEGGRGDSSWWRGAADMRSRISLGPGSLELRAAAGIGSVALPEYRSFVLGGVGTLPGVPFRALGGREMAWTEAAWALPIALPTPPFPYSHYVRLASSVAPLLALGVAGGNMATLPWRGSGEIEPIAGARLDLWGPLVRIEGGVALRTGRVAVAFDVHPDWWPLM